MQAFFAKATSQLCWPPGKDPESTTFVRCMNGVNGWRRRRLDAVADPLCESGGAAMLGPNALVLSAPRRRQLYCVPLNSDLK